RDSAAYSAAGLPHHPDWGNWLSMSGKDFDKRLYGGALDQGGSSADQEVCECFCNAGSDVAKCWRVRMYL
ncbi:MAG: hypothetical protein ACJ8EL_18010, partial [Rhizomicrobium sp.]